MSNKIAAQAHDVSEMVKAAPAKVAQSAQAIAGETKEAF